MKIALNLFYILALFVLIEGYCDIIAENEEFLKVKSVVCNKDKRPTDDQWTELVNCKNLSLLNLPKFNSNITKWQSRIEECSKQADDVGGLLAGDNGGPKDQVVHYICSKKFSECEAQVKKDWEKSDDMFDVKSMEEMMKQLDVILKCGMKALNIK